MTEGISIAPHHGLSFCECFVIAESIQKPFQNTGEKSSRDKEIFGADVIGPWPTSSNGMTYWKMHMQLHIS